jgi:hypothetical protein
MIGVEEKEGVEGKASRKEYHTLIKTPRNRFRGAEN